MTAVCPVCAGQRMTGHPSGFTWQHAPTCRLRTAEDARLVADHDTLGPDGWSFTRPATDTERVLLTACGVDLPADAVTVVAALTPSVLHRGWAGVDLDGGQAQ